MKAAALALLLASLAAVTHQQGARPSDRLPTGKFIQPVGKHTSVGSYPLNMVKSPDGRYAVVTTVGFREQLSVIRLSDGELVDSIPFNKENGKLPQDGLYYGLAFHPTSGQLYVSRGAQDRISRFDLSAEGKLTALGDIETPAPKERRLPYHIAGLAFDSSGSTLVAVDNQTGHKTDYKGLLSLINSETGAISSQIEVGGFPLDTVVTGGKAYVGCERDGQVDVVNLSQHRVTRAIHTGAQPVDLLLDQKGARLFVANSGSDTVSIIDTKTDKIIKTLLLRPTDLRGLPGTGPLGMSLSPDEATLYVACSDMNAVAVVDLKTGVMQGYVPTGWLPTSLVATSKSLLVASAKGIQAVNPNGKPVGDWGQYIENIIEGTVSLVPTPTAGTLKPLTETVLANNLVKKGLDGPTYPGFTDPGIEHVIYIIKENRTYDNVLGDLPQGNGDPSICLFPRAVSPNLHALAERFVLLDNFHVCAEVSQDGWVWSTAGMLSAYASRNTPYNYSGRGRSYDTEGENNGVPVDLLDLPDVTRPPSGYIWELCKKAGVSYRNYGFFTQSNDFDDKRAAMLKKQPDNMPVKKLLMGMTDIDFRRYDNGYADSDLWVHYNSPWPKQRKFFGANNMPSRYSEWKREFDGFIAKGNVPQFMMVRFGQDHTSGTAVGQPTPQAMVADNDYAVGKVVEAVSHSPIWSKTVICVLEDDAQGGYDHVDSHRSTAYVISPYIKRGTIDSRFYNTDSMLRTMELVLGMPPMSQYDAVASPVMAFQSALVNAEPYTAIVPDREIATGVNRSTAYRAKDSARISRYVEESEVDEDLNDILWGAIKGAQTPRPKVINGWRIGAKADPD